MVVGGCIVHGMKVCGVVLVVLCGVMCVEVYAASWYDDVYDVWWF